MKSANIAMAKNQLSRLLRRVKRGETIIITERDRPVARLLPIAASDQPRDAEIAELVDCGALLPPAGNPLDVAAFLDAPRPRIHPGASLTAAVLAEREEAR